jgi:hypothetical protein
VVEGIQELAAEDSEIELTVASGRRILQRCRAANAEGIAWLARSCYLLVLGLDAAGWGLQIRILDLPKDSAQISPGRRAME